MTGARPATASATAWPAGLPFRWTDGIRTGIPLPFMFGS